MKILIAGMLVILLSGCFGKSIIHPPKPLPILTYESNLFISDGNICMTSEQFLEHRLWLEDIKRYVIDTNDILCFYNKENCK